MDSVWCESALTNCNCNFTFIALNLHHTTDSKALHPFHVQCRCSLFICLIAVGGNRSTRSKPRLKKTSGSNPHISMKKHWVNSSAHHRDWELSVLPQDTSGIPQGDSNLRWQRPVDLWVNVLPTELTTPQVLSTYNDGLKQ